MNRERPRVPASRRSAQASFVLKLAFFSFVLFTIAASGCGTHSTANESQERTGTIGELLGGSDSGGDAAGDAGALAQNKAYVPNSGDGTVTVIDTATGAVCTTSTCVGSATYPISVGSDPEHVTITPDGSTVYVSNAGSGSVSVISTSTDTVTATISVPSDPSSLAVLPNGSAVYVIADHNVSVISTSTNTVTATISMTYEGTDYLPEQVLASPDGKNVYVLLEEGFDDGTPLPGIFVIPTSSNTISTLIQYNSTDTLGLLYPVAMALSPDGTTGYVTTPYGIYIVNLGAGVISSLISMDTEFGNIVVSPDGSTAYLADPTSNAVAVLALGSENIVTSVSTGTEPAGMSFTNDGSKLYVANSGSNTASVISTSSYSVLSTISVGSTPVALGTFIEPPSSMSGKQLGPLCPYSSPDAPCAAASAAETLTPTGSASAGEPVDIASGNVTYQYTDYTTAGQNPLFFTRYYNSRGNQGPTTLATEFGVNWRSNYDRYLQIPSASRVIAERPGGKQLTFTLVGSTWTPDSDVDVTLTHSGSSWTLTDSDDTVEAYTTSGTEAVLNSITARNGYAQTLTYTSGLLTSVTDSYSRTLTLAYNMDGTLHTVATPDSTTITYGYTSGQLTSCTFPTSPTSTITYVYADGSLPFALTSVTDENGNTYDSWTYDSFGRGLTSQQGSGANLTTLVYGAGTTTVTNPLGVTDTYTFVDSQAVPKVVSVSRASTGTTAAATEAVTYDSNGYLASLIDWNGNETTYTNNSHGLPTTIVEAYGSGVARTTTIAYDATWVRLPDSIATPGVTTSFTYDGSGDVLTRELTDTTATSTPYSTNGQTRTWTNTWSSYLLASVKTPNSNTTSFGYTSGVLTSITDPLSHVTSVTSYTAGGRPLTIVDPNSVTTTLTYDPRQRLLTSSVGTTGGARTTTYAYDKAGELTQKTLPDSSSFAYTYDTAHRVTQVTNATGDYTTYTLDALGDRTATKVYHSYGSLYAQHGGTFDALGRLLVDTGGRGQTTTYSYDKDGNALTVEDGDSHTTTNTFDALNRLSTSTDANSGVASYTYDAHDRPLTVTDPLSNVTSYVYNGFGDTIQQASPDTGTTVYHFDSDANLTQKVDAASVTVNMTYDALDRQLTRAFPADSTQNVSFTYDQTGGSYTFGLGRLTSFTDAAGSGSFYYDERGAITAKIRTVSSTNYNVTFGYNPAERLTDVYYPSGLHMIYSLGTQGVIGETSAYQPYVSGMGSPFSVFAWTAHGPFGPIDYIDYGNGLGGPIARDYDYTISNITLTDTLPDSGAATFEDVSYTLDGANNVTAITDAVNSSNSQTLGYDVINRLTSATSGSGGYGSLAWAYDKNGNLTSRTVPSLTFSYTYTSGTNRLSSATFTGGGTESFGYTATGNENSVTISGTNTFAATYNVANRMASVSSVGTGLYSAVYGYDGHRVTKTDTGGSPVVYTYGLNGELLEEQSGSTVTSYISEEGWPVGMYVGPVAGGSGGTVYYVQPDKMGAPAFVTDSSQTTVWSVLRDPYGTQTSIGGSLTQNIGLPGQYSDPEAGLFQNWNRDYIPTQGRYVQADLIGLGGGMNPYRYANANPLSNTDSTGLFGPTAVVNIGGAILAFCIEFPEVCLPILHQAISPMAASPTAPNVSPPSAGGSTPADPCQLDQNSPECQNQTPPPSQVKQCRPKGVPSDWVEGPSRKGGGTKYVNPANEHDYVRVKPDGTITQVRNGQAYDVNGNPVSLNSPDAHGILPDQFTFRK